MRWSWQIARVAGIPIRIHATFLLLIIWILLPYFAGQSNLKSALFDAALVLSVFVCIVLHELGHALTARRYGIKTRDITLLPIGGVARLERMPERPRHEILVALAGPAVNVAIAAYLLLIMCLLLRTTPAGLLSTDAPAGFLAPEFRGAFIPRLFAFNLMIVLFNMIPAFPMDGGRVLRALLATRLDYVRATQIAAGFGQGIAVLFAFIGLQTHAPFLFLIALFVFLAAGQESSMAQMRTAFAGVPVSGAMITDFRTLQADEPVERAMTLLLEGHQQDFPVMSAPDGRLPIGILTRRDILSALAAGARDQPVGEITRRDCGRAHPREYLEDVFPRIEQSGCPALLVVSERGDLMGMLTLENVGELAMVQAALERSRGGGRKRGGAAPKS